jgi:hypothetical protein
MTPAEEARFIDLWQHGVKTAAIAQQLGIPRGTVASRAHTLVRQGKIQPRPRGGAPRRRVAQARPEGTPAPPAPPGPPATPAPPAMTFVAVPEIQEMLAIMKDLQARVIALEQTRVPPALPAPPAPPAAARQDIQQWTVRLSKALIEHIKAVAYARRLPPSQLLEALVWHALNDRSPPRP